MQQLFDTQDPEDSSEQDIINRFVAEVEMCGGPTMSLRNLEKFVYKAPDAVRKGNDFCYLIGLLFARYMYEVIDDFNPDAEIGPYVPFNDLQNFIMQQGEPGESETETKQVTMLRGFYDGRLIHEEFGGINNEDPETLP